MNLQGLREALTEGRIEWRKHVLQRLAERNILQEEVIKALQSGEVIEDYHDDKPYPSSLFLGSGHHEPLHVVVAFDEGNKLAYSSTAYRPSAQAFESDYRTRKRR